MIVIDANCRNSISWERIAQDAAIITTARQYQKAGWSVDNYICNYAMDSERMLIELWKLGLVDRKDNIYRAEWVEN